MFNTAKATLPVPSSPCFNCTDRYIGCHASCKRYKDFKEERIELAYQIRKKVGMDRSADSVIINGIQKRRNKTSGRKPPLR